MKPPLTWVFKMYNTTTVEAPVDADVTELIRDLENAGVVGPELLRKEWPAWAWPGGYPIFYYCADGGVLCSKCANNEIKLTSDPDADDQWKIVDADINYEDTDLLCDHCGKHVESAYGETDPDPT